MSSSSILGILIGSLLGSKLTEHNRRKVLITSNLIAILATSMTMVFNVFMICAGRLIFGVCCGIFTATGSKMLDETVPVSHIKLFGTATNIFLSAGVTTAMCLGIILPDEDDTAALKADEVRWRMVYAFPAIC